MKTERFFVDNGHGWRLSMVRWTLDGGPRAGSRPALIVPGYGMNSFIFGFHPGGPSLVESLAARGLEVWTADLRGQGRSLRVRGSGRYGLYELAVEDLRAAIGHVLGATTTGARRLDLVGCSLGAALSFAHVACVPDAPVHALVSLGGLVTFKEAHPLVRYAFASPRLAGMLRIKNTRRMARLALPVLAKIAPSLISVYINERSTDLSQSERMVQTVEDPHPVINREIAEWIKRGDLVVGGVNVSASLPAMKHPFLCVVANNDGIVLPVTSRHTFEVIGSPHKELLLVGDDETPIAHADLFLSRGAQQKIFAPIAEFLLDA